MDEATLRERAAAIRWFHRLDLGRGIVTPGVVDPAPRLPGLGLPGSLAGLDVLDVGAWDGFFSFEAERRGAARVVAVDSYSWGGEGWGSKAGFDLAREALGSRVEDAEVEVLDLSPDRLGRFDLVLFLNVLYHMRHPLLALERVASVTRGRLIVETHTDLADLDRPAMAFYPAGEMWGDRTTYWGPNLPLLVAMLEDVGFPHVEVRGEAPRARRLARAMLLERERGVPVAETMRRGWAVVHAWR